MDRETAYKNMENLEESVILRKYQNLDPIFMEYRNEAFHLFQEAQRCNSNTVFSLYA